MLVFHGRWSNHADSTFNANRFHFLGNDDYVSKRIGCRHPSRLDSNKRAHGARVRTRKRRIPLVRRHDTGLYISLDNAHTWRPTPIEFVELIAIDRNTVYVSGGSNRNHCLFRSDDRGNTWKPINNGIRRRIFKDGRDEIALYPEVQHILVTRSGTVIAVMYRRVYTSADRGETWHNVTDEWVYHRDHLGLDDLRIGFEIDSMTEFDGYLWASAWFSMFRSPDNGETWEQVSGGDEYISWVTDWAVLNDRLYASSERDFGRYEEGSKWDVLTQGLPPNDYTSYGGDIPDKSHITSLAVHRGRLFAGLHNHGVYMFDARSQTWIPAGLQGLTVTALVTHQSHLYAATGNRRWKPQGIYRASIPTVQAYGKAATMWGRVKQEDLAK